MDLLVCRAHCNCVFLRQVSWSLCGCPRGRIARCVNVCACVLMCGYQICDSRRVASNLRVFWFRTIGVYVNLFFWGTCRWWPDCCGCFRFGHRSGRGCLCALSRVEGIMNYMISNIYPGFGHSKFSHSFIHSVIHWFIDLFSHLFIRSFIHCLFIYSFIHWVIQSFIYSFSHSFIHSVIHSFIRSLIHSFIHCWKRSGGVSFKP